jgi:hypothetical protein
MIKAFARGKKAGLTRLVFTIQIATPKKGVEIQYKGVLRGANPFGGANSNGKNYCCFSLIFC